MKQFLFLFLVFLFTPKLSFGQDKKALSFYENGVEAFKQRDYKAAKIFFDKSLERSPEWPEAFFGMGQVYAAQLDNENARKYYLKAIGLDSTNKTFLPAYSHLGRIYLKENNYEKSKYYYEKALAWTRKDSRMADIIEQQIAACDFSILTIKNAYQLMPIPLSKVVNFKQKQYFPVLTADENQLFFTARDGMNDENIFVSKKVNGNWEEPVSISDSINTDFNEGTCTISADGKVLVFTSCEGRENFGSCDLYFTRNVNGNWSSPENLGEEVNSKYWDSQPTLSGDGKTLIFSSSRPLGEGKKDLYISVWNDDSGWSTARNLGKTINTFGDEVSPFIHANSKTMFFASNIHQGLGGFDLFLSQREGSGFSIPENLGYPINTDLDQLAMFISSNGRTAYYSLDQGDSVKLYQFEIPKALMEKINPTIYVKGKVIDIKRQKGIPASIELIEIASNETVSSFASEDSTGEFLAVVPSAGEYALYISNPAYFFKRLDFNVEGDRTLSNEEINVGLKIIEKDVPEILQHIYFAFASYELRDESLAELDKLTRLAKENPQLKIQIAGHTDDVGSAEDNLVLSEKRAQSVTTYLESKGIPLERLSAKGFGESVPIVPNDSEENKQKNRRIELRFF